MPRTLALTALSDLDLERLLRALVRGELACPVSKRNLALAGLTYLWDRTDFLVGLDEQAARSVLVAVIAERRARVAP